MGKALRHSFRTAFAAGALALGSAAIAQTGPIDPTGDLPAVDATGLVGAARACIAASASGAVDPAIFTRSGWTQAVLSDEDGEAIDVPVAFLSRGSGDPLVIVPQVEGAPPVCVASGVIAAGRDGIPAVQAAFSEAFGPGQTEGDEAIYQQGAKVVVLAFEDDAEQGLTAQVAIIQTGD